MRKNKSKIIPVWIGIASFSIAFVLGVASKLLISPSWSKKYEMEWSNKIGTRVVDLSYDSGEENKYDLYLPADTAHESYGLVVYLHPGGFTSGDKSGDEKMLSWLCSKGYVAAGINYTLVAELENGKTNGASVLTQSNEIKKAIPQVIDEAKRRGYNIDKMAIGGGSAGHTLAMLYAYRDAIDAPVPVKLTFGAVGPSSFYKDDWDNYGFDQKTEEAYQGAAGIFSAMSGIMISADEIKDDSYIEKMESISAIEWITPNSPATVVAYGKYDKIQPFKASLRLRDTLEKNNVDYKYFEMPHSGHGLQNDNKIYHMYLETIEKYLEKYMSID